MFFSPSLCVNDADCVKKKRECIKKKNIYLTDQVKGFIVTGGNQQLLQRINCAGGILQSWLRREKVRGEKMCWGMFLNLKLSCRFWHDLYCCNCDDRSAACSFNQI